MTDPNLDIKVLDTDCGIGVIKPGLQELYPIQPINWELYKNNRVKLLNIVSTFSWLKEQNIDYGNNFTVWDGSPF